MLAAMLSATLVACGGGGDAAPEAGSAAGPQGLSAANGRWGDSCASSVNNVKKAGTDTSLSLGLEFNWQAQNGKLVGTRTIRVYEATDCSGTALATLTSAVELTDRGTTVASGKTATKVDFAMDALMPGFSARTITINQVTYLNDDGRWTTPEKFKELIYAEGDRLFTSEEDAATDAQGYPTTLDLAPSSALVRLN